MNPFAGYDLTEPQIEACLLVARGMTYEQAGKELGVCKQAIHQRINGSLKKLGLKSSKDLTRFVIDQYVNLRVKGD